MSNISFTLPEEILPEGVFNELIFKMCLNRNDFPMIESKHRKDFFESHGISGEIPPRATRLYWRSLIHAIANSRLGGGALKGKPMDVQHLPNEKNILGMTVVCEKNEDKDGRVDFLRSVMIYYGELLK